MVIARLPLIGLSADYGDIILSELTEDISLVVKYSGNEILSEIYTPDSTGAVYIRDIALLAEMYRSVNELSQSGDGIETGLVTLTVSITIGGQEVVYEDIQIYPCDVETAGTLTVSILKNIPLTRCLKKKVCKDQTEYISFYGGGSLSVDVHYMSETSDAVQTITIGNGPDQRDIYRSDVSPAVISELSGIEVSKINYYSVYKTSEYKVRYTMDRYQSVQKTFVFLNAFGAQETFSCLGEYDTERKWTREKGLINRKQQLISRDMNLSVTCNTGYLTRGEVEVLEDLLNAKQICIIDRHGWQLVSIEEETFVAPSRFDELIDVEFSYRIASGNQRQFRFAGSTGKKGIFDSTFDSTFN